MVGDSAATEHSVLLEHTAVAAEPSTYDYTTPIVKIVVVVQTVVVATIE